MARWNRAARLLPPDARRVLDLGCAFGHGTGILARRHQVVGVDVSLPYLRRAARSVPDATFARAVGSALPFPDGAFDAVVCLDVLEHVPDERTLTAEIARVLRPGGTLILSTPHTGPLARFDAINVLPGLHDMEEIAPGRDLSTESGPVHRHYAIGDVRRLLGPRLRIEQVRRTGLGIAELVNIPLLLLCKRLLRLPRLYDALQYIYFTVYIVEDMLPMGRYGYHLMIRARRSAP